ncbi:MAG: 4Fe-4S binding protein [Planctomycetota bacterium]|jgi:NADH-quinone oxidoreductase subunit I
MSYFGSIVTGFRSLLTGLGITGREIGTKSVTLQYPHEEPELSESFRSVIQLVRFEETGSHDCIACMQCVKICPSDCIRIEGGKLDGIKKMRAWEFEIDFALCSLCGLCLDTCPTETLEWSNHYDDAGQERQWVYDLIAPHTTFEEQFRANAREKDAREAAEKAAKKEAAAKAKAEKAAREAAEAANKPDESEAGPGGDG